MRQIPTCCYHTRASWGHEHFILISLGVMLKLLLTQTKWFSFFFTFSWAFDVWPTSQNHCQRSWQSLIKLWGPCQSIFQNVLLNFNREILGRMQLSSLLSCVFSPLIIAMSSTLCFYNYFMVKMTSIEAYNLSLTIDLLDLTSL